MEVISGKPYVASGVVSGTEHQAQNCSLAEYVWAPARRADSGSRCRRPASDQAPLVLCPALGAWSFSFSSAAGIIWPNIELSIAVGINPALLLSPFCPPDIRNCGTSG